MKSLSLLLAWMLFVPSAQSQTPGLTVVIIRHGERNDATGNLSCKGLHRAMALPQVMNAKFKTFSAIYVPALGGGKSTSHARMFQTATPVAVQDNLPLNSKFAVGAANELATDILKKTGTVLVVWEHDNISDIAAALGVKDKHLKWGDSDFDSIWILRIGTSKKGNAKADLTIDKEGLHPPDACNF
jgi:hypothetical protein